MNGLQTDGLSRFLKIKVCLQLKKKKINIKNSLLENAKKDLVYKKVMESFSDAELVDFQIENENND